jgi:cell division protein FtsW
MKVAITVLAFCVTGLLALGTVMLASSPAGGRLLMQQIIWSIIGIFVCAGIALFDYRKLKRVSWFLLAACAVLLVLVFAPGIGVKAGGANRWLNLQIMNFQPSELAKIALILAIAHYGERYQRKMRTFKKGILIPGLFVAPILGLIFLEPDYGTTILLTAVAGMMLIVAGVRLTVIAPLAILVLAGFAAAVMSNDVRRGRVIAFLNPEEHQQAKGYQQHQATIALGSGGLFGVGLGDGRQKHGYVPANHTDFILAIVGEELGLVATGGVIVAFVAIAICGMCIAFRACDRFGVLLASGITFLIALQAFINIGVVTSSLPNKGLPLPFVSYGGSSVVAMLGCAGLLFSVARHARERAPKGRQLNPFSSGEIASTQLS